MPSQPPPRLRVDVVLPCYNEATVLRESVTTVLAFLDGQPGYDWRLVIAENGSTDGTAAIAEDLAATDSRVIARTSREKGRGLALQRVWLASDADIVSYMDVDLSTDLAHLPRLVDMVATGGCEVAIGSRLARGSKTRRSLKREITSRGYVLLIRATFPRLKLTDAQCGFKALSRRTINEVVPLIENRMWFFDTEMLILAHRRGLRICELPVRWIEDPDTKVRIIKTAVEDIRGLLRMRFKRLSSTATN
jgi:glycosyltransferase involved in cell wall biosynthesis